MIQHDKGVGDTVGQRWQRKWVSQIMGSLMNQENFRSRGLSTVLYKTSMCVCIHYRHICICIYTYMCHIYAYKIYICIHIIYFIETYYRYIEVNIIYSCTIIIKIYEYMHIHIYLKLSHLTLFYISILSYVFSTITSFTTS